MSSVSLGVVGLGSMGLGMAKNAVKAGLPVKGFDIFEGSRRAFAEAGGTAAASAAEAAGGADVLLLVVVNAEQVEAILFGGGGAAEVLPQGAVVMVCSTIAPRAAREIGARLAAQGFLMLDAPVSGGKVGAEAGTLTVMASGPDEAFEKARPVLDAIAGEVRELGSEAGLGATYKVVHQLAAGVHLAVAAEVMALGANMGCDPDVLFDIVSKSAGRSWMFTDRVPHMLDDDFTPRSMVDIFVKDLGLVVGAGYDSKTPLPLASAALQLFLAASSMGHGKIDDAAVVKVYESATGAAVKRGG
ncbi:MAG: NAD(P)-binding domain-containing protein [Kiloniellaceae bacterium]